MTRHRPPDHHGMRGLVDHFVTANRGRKNRRTGRAHHNLFGRRLLRANAAICDRCIAADARDARLRRMHAAYRRRAAS